MSRLYDPAQLDLLQGNLHATIDAQIERFKATTSMVEPDRPDPITVPGDTSIETLDKPLLTFPSLQMKTQGEFPGGNPVGMVVHFLAGRFEKGLQSAKDAISYGQSQGYAFWCMATDGQIIQSHPLNRWGYHCGESKWEGLGTSLSNRLLGLEICNAGRLREHNGQHYPWWCFEKSGAGPFKGGDPIPADQIRHIETPRYPGESAGFYHKYTEAQEQSLIDLILFLRSMVPGFQIAHVLGHDEIAPHRKNDPGGSLSMGMPELRKKCTEIYLQSQKGKSA